MLKKKENWKKTLPAFDYRRTQKIVILWRDDLANGISEDIC
jgi:hypothetical protein